MSEDTSYYRLARTMLEAGRSPVDVLDETLRITKHLPGQHDQGTHSHGDGGAPEGSKPTTESDKPESASTGRSGASTGAKKTKKVKQQEPREDVRQEVISTGAIRVGKEVQRYAEEHNEAYVAGALGGQSLADNEAADVILTMDGKVHGVELKTMVSNKANKITMKADAKARKRKWERKNKGTMHMVVLDDSEVFNAKGPGKHDPSKRKIYYRRGFGSFSTTNMHEAKSLEEVKELIGTPKRKLPPGAKHLPGQHDQSTHGSGGSGVSSDPPKAKTVQEAQDWATGRLAKEVDYSKITDVRVANKINEVLSEQKRKCKDVSIDKIQLGTLGEGVVGETFVLKRQIAGEHGWEDGPPSYCAITLNQDWWKSADDYRSKALLVPHTAVVDGGPGGVLRHEFGHVLDAFHGNRKITKDVYANAPYWKKDQISTYAGWNDQELTAELFVHWQRNGSEDLERLGFATHAKLFEGWMR